MNEKGFSIGAELKYGWRTARANQGFFVALLFGVAVVALATNLLEAASEGRRLVAIISFLVSLAVGVAIQAGSVSLSLAFLDRPKGDWDDFFGGIRFLPAYLMATVAYYLIVLAGLLLGVVPGIIWGARYGLYGYCLIDLGKSPIESLKESSRLTDGARWDVLTLYGVSTVNNILGALALLVGLFATIPTGWLAMARAYRTLLAQTEALEAPVAVFQEPSLAVPQPAPPPAEHESPATSEWEPPPSE